MAVIIGEVTVEVTVPGNQPTQGQPAPQQSPLSMAEQELVQTLALIQQRQQRLKVD